MTWHDIEWACGHRGRADVNGENKRARARRIEQLAHRDCDECWQNYQKSQREARTAAAAAEAAAAGLPELTGTPNQIAWALTLRSDALKLLGLIEKAIHDKDPFAEHQRALVKAYRGAYVARDDAKSWIEQRDASPTRRFERWQPAVVRQRLQARHGSWQLPRHLITQAEAAAQRENQPSR